MGADMMFNEPDEPVLSVAEQAQQLQDKLELYEKENEELHGKINTLEQANKTLAETIVALRQFDTIDPVAHLQQLDFWRNQLGSSEFARSSTAQEVEGKMTKCIQEIAQKVKDQANPRAGVSAYLDEKGHEYRRQLSVIAEQLDEWIKTEEVVHIRYHATFKHVAADIRRQIGE